MNPVTRTLRERFEEVCLAELHRLRRKTASLLPEHRAEVGALSIEVARAIASRLSAPLERPDNDDLGPLVLGLFTPHVDPADPRSLTHR